MPWSPLRILLEKSIRLLLPLLNVVTQELGDETGIIRAVGHTVTGFCPDGSSSCWKYGIPCCERCSCFTWIPRDDSSFRTDWSSAQLPIFLVWNKLVIGPNLWLAASSPDSPPLEKEKEKEVSPLPEIHLQKQTKPRISVHIMTATFFCVSGQVLCIHACPSYFMYVYLNMIILSSGFITSARYV